MQESDSAFHLPSPTWQLSMQLYLRYLGTVCNVLLLRSASRLAELDGGEGYCDIMCYILPILAWTAGWRPRTKYYFAQADQAFLRPFPDWMSCTVSRKGNKYPFDNLAWPMFYSKGIFTNWADVWKRIYTMRRRMAFNNDFFLTEHVAYVVKVTGRSLQDVVPGEKMATMIANDYSKDGGPAFPHYCNLCSSYAHNAQGCNKKGTEDLHCQYFLCKATTHSTSVCPILGTICPDCEQPGHRRQDHARYSLVRLRNEFDLMRIIHVRGCRLIAINVGHRFAKQEVTSTEPRYMCELINAEAAAARLRREQERQQPQED